MPRYFLTLEYHGGPFCGWQRQAHGQAVQAVVEGAVAAFAGVACTVQAAGRTDAGVHATGQVAHVDLPKLYPDDTVQNALNHYLRPHPIAVAEARRVPDDAHARFDARQRAYRYVIRNRRPPLTWEAGLAWHVPTELDVEAMARGAAWLEGRHDFTSFRDADCQARSPVKTLDRLHVVRSGDRLDIAVEARSFLHHQVRNMVGTLVLVGRGAWPPERVAEALRARDRQVAGPTAPAAGLYLERVWHDLNRLRPDDE